MISLKEKGGGLELQDRSVCIVSNVAGLFLRPPRKIVKMGLPCEREAGGSKIDV